MHVLLPFISGRVRATYAREILGAHPSDEIRGIPTGDGGRVASHRRYPMRLATEAHEEPRKRKERALRAYSG